MTFNYTSLAKTAAKTLKDFGKPLTLRDNPEAVYDPTQGTTSGPSPKDTIRNGVIFDFGAGQTEVRGNLIQVTDKRCLLEVGTKPTTEDQIIDPDGGVIYKIVSVGEIKPATIPVLYDLHLHG